MLLAHLPPGPPCAANCTAVLQKACPRPNKPNAPASACVACIESHSVALLRSGCTQDGAQAWCAGGCRGSDAQLQLVSLAESDPGAKALDGSSTHFYYSPASAGQAGRRGANRTFVFFMEGGSDCTDEASCQKIVASGQGSGHD